MKRIGSLLLCCVLLFMAIASTNNPAVKTVQAANGPGQLGSDDRYIEPTEKVYNPNDGSEMLLYDTRNINGWAPSDDFIHLISSGTSAYSGDSNNGEFKFRSGFNKGTGMNGSYRVVRRNSSISPDAADIATTDQLRALDYFGADKMLGVWCDDMKYAQDASGTTFFYNLTIQFNHPVDLTMFSHIYFDYWLSDFYSTGTPGTLRVVFWGTGQTVFDGFQYDLDFTKLKRDGSTAVTGHRHRIDIRDWASTNNAGGTHKKNQIGGVTFRYTCPTTNKGSYSKGPKIYFGKMIAHTMKDNLQPGSTFYSNSTGSTTYTKDTILDKNQGVMYVFAGANTWNKSTVLYLPTWIGQVSLRIVGLEWGNTSSSTVDYYYNMLERGSWRWRRKAQSSSASNNETKGNFPAEPTNGGGGNLQLQVFRNNDKYITANAQKSVTVS